METNKVLARMLKENTGTHFLDSGGANGRAWQRNQARDFDREPTTSLSWRWGLEVTHNVYHWLNERLDFSPTWQARFDAFVESKGEDDRSSWPLLMEEFFDDLREKGHEVCGIYGEGGPLTVNTYNHTSLLSQTIQFTYATVDGDGVILLQIHGGADVRGGYTAPKAFTENGSYGELGIFDDHRGRIVCPECRTCWYTNDGYNWYFDGSAAGKSLNAYKVVKHGDECGDVDEVTTPLKGIVYVDENGGGHCPLCAKGVLRASW